MVRQRVIVSPDTFIWTNGSLGIAYNSSIRTGYRFENTMSISEYIDIIQRPESLYSAIVPSSVDKEAHTDLQLFLNRLVKEGMAKIVADKEDIPLSLKPILKIQDDVSYYRWLNGQGIDGEVINNLHKIVVNLGSCIGSNLFACQSPFPVHDDVSILNAIRIKQFIKDSAQSSFLSEINIIGNPIGKFDEEFYAEIKSISPIRFSVLADDMGGNYDLIRKLQEFGKLELVIRVSTTLPQKVISLINKFPETDLCFIVEKEEDIDLIHSLGIDGTTIGEIRILPIYNSTKKAFIMDTLAINEDDLLINGPDKRSIFIHESINIFDFGKLYIMPDGKVLSNMCSPAIGTIEENPKDIVYRELDRGKSWLKTRNNFSCTKCVFRSLCPSFSNYEKLLGRPLCTIYNDMN